MERHQTLRETVSWSYRLLDEQEQLLFDRFSVFAGGASLEAVREVCSGEGVDPDEVLELLFSLVNKSMLTADRTQARTRFKALETLRQFGGEQLERRGEVFSRRDLHLVFFADWVERTDAAYVGPRATFAPPDAREWDNLHAALHWALARGDLDRAVKIVVISDEWAAHWIRPDHLDWVIDTIEHAASQDVEVAQLEGCRAGWLLFAGELDERESARPTTRSPSRRPCTMSPR